MGIRAALQEGSRRRKELVHDESGWIAIVAVLVVSAAALLGTYWFVSPIGEGIGDMFTIFGGSISLYIVIGLVIVALVFLWLVFGKED